MRINQRDVTQYQAFCDWCGVNVGAWYADCRTMLRCLVIHRRLHRDQMRMGRSIRAVDFP